MGDWKEIFYLPKWIEKAANKYAWKFKNNVYSREDLKQDIWIDWLKYIREVKEKFASVAESFGEDSREFEYFRHKMEKSIVPTARKIINTRILQAGLFYSRRPDTSKFKEEILEEILADNYYIWTHTQESTPLKRLISTEDRVTSAKVLRKFLERLDGNAKKLYQEYFNPSPRVVKKWEGLKKENPSRYDRYDYIPLWTIGRRILGLKSEQIKRIQQKADKILDSL